jgi:hypothetical protein
LDVAASGGGLAALKGNTITSGLGGNDPRRADFQAALAGPYGSYGPQRHYLNGAHSGLFEAASAAAQGFGHLRVKLSPKPSMSGSSACSYGRGRFPVHSGDVFCPPNHQEGKSHGVALHSEASLQL